MQKICQSAPLDLQSMDPPTESSGTRKLREPLSGNILLTVDLVPLPLLLARHTVSLTHYIF